MKKRLATTLLIATLFTGTSFATDVFVPSKPISSSTSWTERIVSFWNSIFLR